MHTLGIILAAGKSTRLYPASLVATKQLLPVYDKPLIYYPLTTLMLAGVRDFVVVCAPEELASFKKLFENCENEMGIRIWFGIQPTPKGIADAFNVVNELLKEKIYEYDTHALILGDNIFYGSGMSGLLKDTLLNKPTNSAVAFLYQVPNPQEFGVAEVSGSVVKSIQEKPSNPKSNYAITGLYFYPPSVYLYTPQIFPSKRGELEISDLNSYYLTRGEFEAQHLRRGMVWFDTGTPEAMFEASSFIHNIQKHQNFLIGSPHEIAIRNQWVTREQITPFIEKCTKTPYGKYLQHILG